VRRFGRLDLGIALLEERADDLFGVVDIHLAAEGFEVEGFPRHVALLYLLAGEVFLGGYPKSAVVRAHPDKGRTKLSAHGGGSQRDKHSRLVIRGVVCENSRPPGRGSSGPSSRRSTWLKFATRKCLPRSPHFPRKPSGPKSSRPSAQHTSKAAAKSSRTRQAALCAGQEY